ncbi:hypothetical protein AK812_SmicGene25410 [Symbiodinium microadriaticum]|uniref:C3H1-type domain-containing protein n=1 Tax=Symbiodinium microadriaticum TaxID=2951 RepID=A0A1Q9DC62_SYMMI|nr:hypothetical protein AK812_SmicGene25410 [Symbiodinium microadriaticum]
MQAPDLDAILVAGHSMGGHGALLLAASLRGQLLGIASSAGWLRKDQYADSNKVLLHDVASPWVEPALATVLRECEVEFDAEALAPSLVGVPILLRVGSRDRTVHPWFSRRMLRTLRAAGAPAEEAKLTEVAGQKDWNLDDPPAIDPGDLSESPVEQSALCFASLFLCAGEAQSFKRKFSWCGCWLKHTAGVVSRPHQHLANLTGGSRPSGRRIPMALVDIGAQRVTPYLATKGIGAGMAVTGDLHWEMPDALISRTAGPFFDMPAIEQPWPLPQLPTDIFTPSPDETHQAILKTTKHEEILDAFTSGGEVQTSGREMSEKEKWQLHRKHACFPCVAFALREGGCFKGDSCSHCHYCDANSAKTRRRQLQQESRRRRRAELARQGRTASKPEPVAPVPEKQLFWL